MGTDNSTLTPDATSPDGQKNKNNIATKGAWVQVHSVVLSPQERSGKIPDDTRAVPLEMWVHGFLLNDSARVGDEVEVETAIGRTVKGTLQNTRPGYTHTFGRTLPELAQVGRQLKKLGYSLRETE